jgi:hypothetical protein
MEELISGRIIYTMDNLLVEVRDHLGELLSELHRNRSVQSVVDMCLETAGPI